VAGAPAEKGEVVATYKGREITSGDLVKELERLPAPSRVYLTQPERRRQFVDNMIMNDLLFREGEQQGLQNDLDTRFAAAGGTRCSSGSR